jgi:integrating conjugative element protein (TIGR03756 family)
MSVKKILFIFLLAAANLTFASTAPPSKINSAEIIMDSAMGVFTYSHFEVIGACTWLDEDALGIPYINVTLELDEYLPDLLIAVFNEKDDDPWDIGNTVYDPIANDIGNDFSKSTTGTDLTNGQVAISNEATQKGIGMITKYVDVVGNLMPMNYIPFPHLPGNTSPLVPYYSSAVDWLGRLGMAETIQPETYNVFGGFVGNNFADKWDYLYPREMTVETNNDYIASVLTALRAAALVTNNNPLHIIKSTTDSCGTNCSVANVVAETNDDHEIFQEIYPNNKHIQLGESQLKLLPTQVLGSTDDSAGNGNYVFIVWRHYRGCMPNGGKFLWANVTVPPTSKAGV